MSLGQKLERSLGRFAVHNLSLLLVMGQVGVYLLVRLGKLDAGAFVFEPRLALEGQWWRALSFLLMPPPSSFLFIAFAWWMFYLMGSALEAYWGALRYNAFVLLGVVLTVGLSFLQPDSAVTNAFLAGSVFLAFAHLNPNFELLILFILPVKIKWLALLAWVAYAFRFLAGDGMDRLLILAAVGNYLVFFGRDIARHAGMGRRTAVRTATRVASAATGREDEPRHRCRTCGKTDRTDPQLDFRYCSKCAGDACYCPEHMRTHEHIGDGVGDGGKA